MDSTDKDSQAADARVEWEERMRMGQHAFNQGNYKEAKRQFEKAVEMSRQLPDRSAGSLSRLNLAMTLGAAGRDDLAEPLFQEALQADEQNLPAGSRELAVDYIDIGAHYGRLSRFSEAESMYTRAIDILQKNSGTGSESDLALALSNLGLLYLQQGQAEKAEAPLRKALDIRETTFAKNSKEVAESMVNLANLYADTGRKPEARSLYDRAIEILELRLGPDHPEIADVLQDYAELLQEAGETQQANDMEQQAKRIQQQHSL